MQIQITEWLFDQGTEVTITDPTVIAP
jgi:hypothetical protein